MYGDSYNSRGKILNLYRTRSYGGSQLVLIKVYAPHSQVLGRTKVTMVPRSVSCIGTVNR